MCRGGITTAQNLPNSDKDEVKYDGWRRNVYHRQIRFSKDEENERILLNRLVDSALHQYVDREKILSFVVGHENGHSLGPTAEYQDSLGVFKHIIEEHKANIASIASIAELAKKAGLPVSLALSAATELELLRLARSCSGGRYQKL